MLATRSRHLHRSEYYEIPRNFVDTSYRILIEVKIVVNYRIHRGGGAAAGAGKSLHKLPSTDSDSGTRANKKKNPGAVSRKLARKYPLQNRKR